MLWEREGGIVNCMSEIVVEVNLFVTIFIFKGHFFEINFMVLLMVEKIVGKEGNR